jgi:hypothetical protein
VAARWARAGHPVRGPAAARVPAQLSRRRLAPTRKKDTPARPTARRGSCEDRKVVEEFLIPDPAVLTARRARARAGTRRAECERERARFEPAAAPSAAPGARVLRPGAASWLPPPVCAELKAACLGSAVGRSCRVAARPFAHSTPITFICPHRPRRPALRRRGVTRPAGCPSRWRRASARSTPRWRSCSTSSASCPSCRRGGFLASRGFLPAGGAACFLGTPGAPPDSLPPPRPLRRRARRPAARGGAWLPPTSALVGLRGLPTAPPGPAPVAYCLALPAPTAARHHRRGEHRRGPRARRHGHSVWGGRRRQDTRHGAARRRRVARRGGGPR